VFHLMFEMQQSNLVWLCFIYRMKY